MLRALNKHKKKVAKTAKSMHSQQMMIRKRIIVL